MAGMYGADIARLRSLAQQFDRAADQLETCRMAVGGSVRTSPWQGPDAGRFRADWDSLHAGQVAAAAATLRTGARQLRTNADQQEQASAVDGGGSGAGGVPASAPAGDPTIPSDGTPPEAVRGWWESLSPEQRQQLIEQDPLAIGNLNGVPLADRVAANQLTAGQRLGEIDDELAALGDKPQPNLWAMGRGGGLAYALQLQRWQEQHDALLQEQGYLEAVSSGRRSLVVYDPGGERIVEMIGRPGPGTREVITYLPGTGADMASFHSGSAQQVATYLTQTDRSGSTVAFVYKDGPWASWGAPWQETSNLNMGFAATEGSQLADFQRTLDLEPSLAGAQRNGMAHSAGMTSLSASEVAGAHYDRVLSLGGAMLAPGWQADPGTSYEHYQYGFDAINYANPIGDLPVESSAFTNNIFRPETHSFLGLTYQNEFENHTRIASNVNNQSALIEMYRDIHSD